MLTWVGKRPITEVTSFPAQLVERFDPNGDVLKQADFWKDWPGKYSKGGLLFHGDNKEVLAHLLANGFRGKVKLIYIDPPFDSGADYVRKVTLRGPTGTVKLEGEGYSIGEQIQYSDIWANDNYLQFMYERLLLLKEFLAEDAILMVHTDPSRNYQIRMLLDEVFGQESFRNEIVWWYWNKMQGNVNAFASNHDTILCYQTGKPTFKKITEEREDVIKQLKRVWDPKTGSLVNAKDEKGNLIYLERGEKTLDDVWRISMLQPAGQTEPLDFPTKKPEDLLSIIIESSSRPGDIVLDCFLGSGTTAAVAQKLGRRWIGCDINKGAIQYTMSRLQRIVKEQHHEYRQKTLTGAPLGQPLPAQLGFSVFRVNDYDLQIQHNEAVNLACEHIGVQRTKNDTYFDGTLGERLVKIAPFNHPLSPADLEDLKKELKARPSEQRDIVVVALGKERAVDDWLDEWNRLRKKGEVPNKVEVIELRTHPKYGKFFIHRPAQARVAVKRRGDKLVVHIEDFVSPTVMERLQQQSGIVKAHVEDWRSVVDGVAIDTAYDGKVFNMVTVDVPQDRKTLVAGKYELEAPAGKTTVAVKITDVLGEEVLVATEV